MKVVWSPLAKKDLHQIYDFIAADSPDNATRVADVIYDRIARLASAPEIGRIGLVSGTRELPITPWPYIAVYRIGAGSVRIIRLRHAAQHWP